MKSVFYGALVALSLAAVPASAADLFTTLQTATLADVKAAEAVYAANPTVPTYKAATQCLGWADSVLSASGGVTSPFNLVAPKGIVSVIADADVALSTANAGVPPIVDAFNENCGWYVEDLKAQAVAHGAGTFLGIKLPF